MNDLVEYDKLWRKKIYALNGIYSTNKLTENSSVLMYKFFGCKIICYIYNCNCTQNRI